MRRMLPALLVLLFAAAPARAAVIFNQPHDGTGSLNKSSWYPPDGLDGDAYCWDSFTLSSGTAITSLAWRGGYEQHPSGSGQSPVSDFSISIYRSIGGNSQPDLGVGGLLVQYNVGGNAGETAAGSFGGVAMYDYTFTLPSPFQAAGGAVYWVEIVASQGAVPPSYAPDWGLARGTGGNGTHFRKITGGIYQTIANDLAFSLSGSSAPTVTIGATVSPAGSGTVSGAGAYPIGSLASLTAIPNPGYGFVNWTESGVPVSTNATYPFTATVDRTLVANFDTAYVVTTATFPDYGGTATGGGTFVNGAMVTLTATAAGGFVFKQWSDGATTSTYSFSATSDVWLTAMFDLAPATVVYDFDTSSPGTGLPQGITQRGLVATFSGDYSVQSANVLGFTPVGFSGLCLYPNSIFASDLAVDFSEHLTGFSVLYAVHELACDASARMRVTAYLDGAFAGTNTMVAPIPSTWTTARLGISVPGGFNRAVVHWDAPGTGCTDYGSIFMADIVVVSRDPAVLSAPDAPAGDVARLSVPAPNPFRSSTSIQFARASAGPVRLTVFDLSGRVVRTLVNASLPAGSHTATWDGTTDAGRVAAAGLYLLRLDSGGSHVERRVVRMN